MTPLANQQVFDTALHHLRKQRSASKKNGMCAYRGNDGRKCGVGAAIPDALYEEWMDPKGGDSTIEVILKEAEERRHPLAALFSQCDPVLLKELQCAHDEALLDKDALPPGEVSNVIVEDMLNGWEAEMKRIAKDYKLEYSAP